MEDKKDTVMEIEENEIKNEIKNEDSKTVTVEEMKRRISNEKKKQEDLKAEFEEYKKQEATRIKNAIEDYSKKSQMNADELAEYTLKENERKHQEEVEKLKNQIAEYQEKEKCAQIKDIAIQKLSEYEINSDEDILNLVLGSSIDETAKKIEILKDVLTSERAKYIGQSAPTISGGLSNSDNIVGSTYDILKKLKGE